VCRTSGVLNVFWAVRNRGIRGRGGVLFHRFQLFLSLIRRHIENVFDNIVMRKLAFCLDRVPHRPPALYPVPQSKLDSVPRQKALRQPIWHRPRLACNLRGDHVHDDFRTVAYSPLISQKENVIVQTYHPNARGMPCPE
jgi:hypothetical protein